MVLNYYAGIPGRLVEMTRSSNVLLVTCKPKMALLKKAKEKHIDNEVLENIAFIRDYYYDAKLKNDISNYLSSLFAL